MTSDDPVCRADPDIDLTRPSPARVYDYQLGGTHNFAVDRRLARRWERVAPGAARRAWAGRAFLRRAVRHCVAEGVDQFLDVGSGIPAGGPVHEVARAGNPASRVVYVDIDPVAVIQSRTRVVGDESVAVVWADLRRPEAILDDPATRRLLDFDRPVAVLVVALLHLIAEADRPAELVARLTARCAPGSYLVISHLGWNHGTPEQVRAMVGASRDAGTSITPRTADQVAALLGGHRPVAPGVVPVHEWRPDPDELSPPESAGYAAVARIG